MKFIFQIVDAQVPVQLRLRTLGQMGIFIKYPMAYIETVVLHSTHDGLISQLKERERDLIQMKYMKVASEEPKIWDTPPTTAEDSQYVPGIKMPMAAAPCRASPKENGEIKGLDVSIYELTPHLTRADVEQIQKTTQGDRMLPSLSTDIGRLV